MGKKHQFSGLNKPRLFYDRKVRTAGHTKVLSVGKLLPDDYYYVRCEVIDREENAITIKITKLLGNEFIASNTQTCEGCKQDA